MGVTLRLWFPVCQSFSQGGVPRVYPLAVAVHKKYVRKTGPEKHRIKLKRDFYRLRLVMEPDVLPLREQCWTGQVTTFLGVGCKREVQSGCYFFGL